jgi:small-conductance mechanosensitive channel
VGTVGTMPDQNRAAWVQTLDDWHLLTVSKIIVVLLIALILNWLARRLIKRIVHGMHSLRTSIPGAPPHDLRSERRARTLTAVLRSTAAAIIWTIAIISVLSDLGVNVGAFIAGASIIGGALAFGAQQIVRDLLAGFFMFSEDQYGVGDSVDLGLAEGTVEEVSLRVTRLRGVDGKVWFVPHGQISRVANLSQDWALAIVDVPVGRTGDLATSAAAIEAAAAEVRDDPALRGDILGAPRVLGVQEVLDDRVVLRVVMRTSPGARVEVQRELRARLAAAAQEGRWPGLPPPPPLEVHLAGPAGTPPAGELGE